MALRKYLVAFILVSSKLLVAQVSDTTEMARQLSYKKDYKTAAALLTAYEVHHPKAINAFRVHAQVLYWMGKYNEAEALYESAIKNNPEQNSILLDYGRMLFNLKKGNKAKEVLNKYLKTDPNDVEATSMLGTIAYWQSNPKLALTYFDLILAKYPTNEWALEYVNKIHETESLYVDLGSEYTSDTQPLDVLNSGIKLGWCQSSWFSPFISYSFMGFNANNEIKKVHDVRLANKFSFPEIQTEITVSAGILTGPVNGTSDWTGKLLLNKKFLKYFTFSALADRLPYLYTISSIAQNVMQTNYGASLNWDKGTSISGQLGYNAQQFADNNTVQSFYAWLLSPPIRFSVFELHLGYAFNFANATENRFTSTESISQIVANYYTTQTISGQYNPYFTPDNQQVHSVVGNLTIQPIKPLKININSNVGVYALAGNPYLYLDKTATDGLFINRGFAQKQYSPMQLTASAKYSITQKTSIGFYYTYLQAFFFTSNTVGFTLNLKFWNGK